METRCCTACHKTYDVDLFYLRETPAGPRRFAQCVLCTSEKAEARRGKMALQQCRDCGKRLGSVEDKYPRRCGGCQNRYAAARRQPALPMAPGNSMRVGLLERREECVNFDDCLTAFAKRSISNGGCPEKCAFYRPTVKRIELETFGGQDLSQWPSGWEL